MLTADPSAETLQARREWQDIFKVMKGKNLQEIYHVHGLEELILLKCPYYPKQSTNLMQSLSKQS